MTVQELEQQIDATRHALDQTLHALQARLSPTRRVRAAWTATQEGGASALRGGLTWAIAHPISVVAVSAAVVVALCARPFLRQR
jgi:hypothetical protein